MAILKIVNKPYDSEEALFNLCQYIIQYERTRGHIGGRGVRVDCGYECIEEAQALWRMNYGRRAYHLILAFDDYDTIVATEAMEIAYQVSSLFFPEYQVLWGVHTEQEHLHIHFAISSVSLIDGRKLHIDYDRFRRLKEAIEEIARCYKI